MIGKVKTINGIKQIIPISSEGITDSVTQGSMLPITSNAVANAIDDEVSARNTAINNAINSLDVGSVGGNNKYIQAIQQTNGLISATEGTVDTTVTQNSDNLVTSGAVYNAIQNSGSGGAPVSSIIPYTSQNVPEGYIDCTAYTETIFNYHIDDMEFSPTINNIDILKNESPSNIYLYTSDGSYMFDESNGTIGSSPLTDLSPGQSVTCAYMYSSKYGAVGTKTGVYSRNRSAFTQRLSNVEAYGFLYGDEAGNLYYFGGTGRSLKVCTSDGVYYNDNDARDNFYKDTITFFDICYSCYYFTIDGNNAYIYNTNKGAWFYRSSYSGNITGTTNYNILGALSLSLSSNTARLIFWTDIGDVLVYDYQSPNSFTQVRVKHVCDAKITRVMEANGVYHIFTKDGLYYTSDTTFATISKELPNVCDTGYLYYDSGTSTTTVYFANNTGFYKHIMGTVESITKTYNYKALSKTEYTSLYAQVGDTYNSEIPDIQNTQFAIPLVADEGNILKYAMKI